MDKGERLASASQLLVHSGNIASWNKLRKKGVLTTTDEVSVNVIYFVSSWYDWKKFIIIFSWCLQVKQLSRVGMEENR